MLHTDGEENDNENGLNNRNSKKIAKSQSTLRRNNNQRGSNIMTSIDVFNQNSEDESMFNELNNVKEVDEKSSIGSEEDEDCPSERISTPSK